MADNEKGKKISASEAEKCYREYRQEHFKCRSCKFRDSICNRVKKRVIK